MTCPFELLVGIVVKNYGCPHDGGGDHDVTAASGLVFGLLPPFWVSDVGYGSGNGDFVPFLYSQEHLRVRPPRSSSTAPWIRTSGRFSFVTLTISFDISKDMRIQRVLHYGVASSLLHRT